MADKIFKYLAKLSTKDYLRVKEVMDKILELDLNTLDIKKMKGFTNKYRARVGDHRIIFTIINKKPNLESIKNRDENTY